MNCFKCGNDIEDNLECPFCGYINKEDKVKIKENRSNNVKVNNKTNIKSPKIGKINKVMSWIFFSLMVMAILGTLMDETDFVTLILYIIIALMCCPPVIEKVQEITKIKITTAIRIIIIFGCLIISGFTTTAKDTTETNVNTQPNNSATINYE